MKILGIMSAMAIAATGWSASAVADPWKDESGKGRWRGGYERGDDWGGREYGHGREWRHKRHSYKEEYRRGGCKVERKWDGGGYKEEVKCKRGRPAYGYYD